MRKRIVSLFIAAALLCTMGMTVFAHEAIDWSYDGSGSITIQMLHDNGPVPGGSLTLYQVGAVSEDDGNYSFVPTGDFEDCGLSLADVTATALPGELAVYAAEHSLKGTTVEIDGKGNVSFDKLKLGLYLLVQEEAAEGFNALNPFLVTVPTNENGAYKYNVDAAPKVQLTPAQTEPPSEETQPPKPTEPSLPQTGQLNWPVPMLAVAGLMLFTLGFILRFTKKRASDEE